ncbi:MAG: acyltransferase family protein [Gemmatimonadaceae bacterium]
MVPEPRFRPDIEGLRGLAILLVVAFHAGALAGGFVGVDVFFVLSGFFITGMLARELASTGTVALTEFYGKRALRLLPALLVVLLVTLAAVMWLYAPIDRAAVAQNARSVALYSGNIDFARNTVDYFGARDNPLLHTWSLAVEEQFYLVWPMLFLVVAGLYGTKHADDPEEADAVTRRRLLIGIVLAGAASFALSVWLTRSSQPWAFFGMPTRIWEFALGGTLAMMNLRSDQPSALAAVLQTAGLLTIAIAVITYSNATLYPGWAALLPAFGAAAMLVGGQSAPHSFVSRWLSTPWLQYLGRLSYAWYLWHWPLIGVGSALDASIGVWGKLAWSGIALVLAWLTYRFIERPARDGTGRLARIPSNWVAPAALGASVAAAVVSQGAVVTANRQVSQPGQHAFAAAREDRMEHSCWATTVEEVRQLCEFGDKSSSTTIVLLGDSHAEHWLGGLDRVGKERGWKIIAMVKGGCPVADMPEMQHARFKRYYHECTRYREAMLQRIIAMRPSAVILSSWDHYLAMDGKALGWQVTPDGWRNGLRRTYGRLIGAGIATVAIRGTPRTWFDVPQCLSRRAAQLPGARACEYDRAGSLNRVAIAAQNDAARGLPVPFIDMIDQICATARCKVTRGGIVMFTDDNHLTASFTRSLAPVLGERVAAALH